MASPRINSVKPPSHMTVIFANDAWMDRKYVLGAQQAEENESPMIICKKGDEKKITWDLAKDLSIAGTVIESTKADNRPYIDAIRQEVKDAAALTEKRAKDPANKHETLDQKIERIVANAMDTILAKLSQPGKKAA